MAGEYTRDQNYVTARTLIKQGRVVTLEYAETGERKTTMDLSTVQSMFKYMYAYKGTVLDEDFRITGVHEATEDEVHWHTHPIQEVE